MDPSPSRILQNSIEKKELEVQRELTAEEKETVKTFEQIPFRNLNNKVGFLMVWRNLKEGSTIDLMRDISLEEMRKIISIVNNAGMYAKIIQRERENQPQDQKTLFVAKTQKSLDELTTLFYGDHLTDPVVYKTLGRIFGYPQTAVDAFGKFCNLTDDKKDSEKELLLTVDELSQSVPKEIFPFAQFRLSRANWPEEIEVVKKWSEEVRLVDPELYKKMVKGEIFQSGVL